MKLFIKRLKVLFQFLFRENIEIELNGCVLSIKDRTLSVESKHFIQTYQKGFINCDGIFIDECLAEKAISEFSKETASYTLRDPGHTSSLLIDEHPLYSKAEHCCSNCADSPVYRNPQGLLTTKNPKDGSPMVSISPTKEEVISKGDL